MLSYIFLECTFAQNLPVALALCLLPFLLGWLAATIWNNVGGLREKIAALTATNDNLHTEITDVRVKLTQSEAEVERLNGLLRKSKDDLMMCESERNALREQGTKGGGKAVAAAAAVMFAGKKWKWDDLKIVEGIGPKIATLLNKAGIKTWKKLSETATSKLKEILEAGGSQYNIHDPSTWAAQARLADQAKWPELQKLQDELNAGKV